MITRATYADIQAYASRAERKDLADDEMPSETLLKGMSRVLDTVCEEHPQNVEAPLHESIEMRRAVLTLTNGPRTCGGFKPENAILGHLTPFEQMSAFGTWMERTGPTIRKQHTFAFLAPGDKVVPIWVKKPKNGQSSLFTTMIGTTRGRLKAPAYPTWAASDPKETGQSHFIDPLFCLETQRQPSFLGSSLLKANPYDAGTLTSDWRYKTTNADGSLAAEGSVEHKKQHTSKVEEIKQRSAGFNLCKMLTTIPEGNLLPQSNYEDYFEEGYDDDAVPFVSATKLCSSISKYIDGETQDLASLTGKLFATRLSSRSEIPVVQEYTREALF